MTNDILPIITFNALILNNLRTQKCHFFCHSAPKCHFLTVTKSVQIGRFRASIVKFARGVIFASNDISNFVHFRATKNKFFPVNTGGVSQF